MKIEYLEEAANNIFLSGLDHDKNGDRERSRRCFAIAWGISRYLENMDLMRVSYDWLREVCLNNYEAEELKRAGYDFVLGIVNLPERVRKEMGGR